MRTFERFGNGVQTLSLAILGFVLFGPIGAVVGIILGILVGIAREIRRGNDLLRKQASDTKGNSPKSVTDEKFSAGLSEPSTEQSEQEENWKIARAFAIGFGIIMLGYFLALNWPTAEPEFSASSSPVNTNGPEITASEFAQLATGMSYEAATEIIGSPGEVLSESDIAGIHTVLLKWEGSGWGSNANATFQNGRLVSKAQAGLR